MKEELLSKITDRSAVVGVVGLGYVGLPFAVEKAKVGYRVLGVEQNPRRAEKINRGENYISDVKGEELRMIVSEGRLEAVTDFARVPEMDVIVICVPTPLTKNLTPDLQYVTHVTYEIANYLRPGQLISLESTTYPGTTEEVMRPILEARGLKAEQDFYLSHSPERVDPGNQRYTTKNTNKVIGGVGPESLEVAVAFYSQTIEAVVPVSSAKAAEMVKVFENTFRAVNIALVNELALLCDRMNLNVWEVLEAAHTKPFGIMPFFPGPGVGGHCLHGQERVRYRWRGKHGVSTMADLYQRVGKHDRAHFQSDELRGVIPTDLEVLSIDPQTGEQAWKPVTLFFARDYEGPMVEIETSDNRRLKVTNRHPMLVNEQGLMRQKDAFHLQPGDLLPLVHQPVPPDDSRRKRTEGINLAADPLAAKARVPAATTVKRIQAFSTQTTVYSLEVADNHTFATSGGIYVHNCIPLDPHYLEWKAKELNFNTHFIALAGEINRKMPEFVREKTFRVLNRMSIAPSRARILMLGIAYKKDLDDARESPAIEILHLLLNDGANIVYHDPFVPKFRDGNLEMCSVPLTDDLISHQDLVIITTDHSNVDYGWVVAHAKHVLDTRNATRNVKNHRERITLL